jgi:hypothetical protein
VLILFSIKLLDKNLGLAVGECEEIAMF